MTSKKIIIFDPHTGELIIEKQEDLKVTEIEKDGWAGRDSNLEVFRKLESLLQSFQPCIIIDSIPYKFIHVRVCNNLLYLDKVEIIPGQSHEETVRIDLYALNSKELVWGKQKIKRRSVAFLKTCTNDMNNGIFYNTKNYRSYNIYFKQPIYKNYLDCRNEILDIINQIINNK